MNEPLAENPFMTRPLLLDEDRGTGSTNRVTNEAGKPEFDETAVLEELERLRGAIRLARSKREEKVAEFETFVRDTRMSARREALRAVGVDPDDDIELRAETAPPVQVAERAQFAAAHVPSWSPGPPPELEVPSPPSPVSVSRLDDMSEATAAFPDPVSHRTRDKYIIAAAAALLIVVLAIVSWIGGDSGTPAARPPQGQTPPPSSQPGVRGPAGPARADHPSEGGAAAAPAPSLPLQVELVALRKVWMRVTVDGDRAIEQEVDEGLRLSFGANRAIVVRAGDAGAVTISVDGQAATPLGRLGQPATRTLVPRTK